MVILVYRRLVRQLRQPYLNKSLSNSVKIVQLVVLKLDEAKDSVPLGADAETQEVEEAIEVTHIENEPRCHMIGHLIIHQITQLNNKTHQN